VIDKMAAETASLLAEYAGGSQLSPYANDNVVFFDKFYKANVHKLIMPQRLRADDIDRAAVLRKIEDAKSRFDFGTVAFGEMLLREVRHVTFDEFYTELRKAATKVRRHCMETGTQLVIYVRQPQSSYMWVTLLVWPILRQFVTDVNVYNSVDAPLVHGKWVVLYVDDAAYSGKQAAEGVAALSRWLGRMDPEVAQHASIGVLIPFMSRNARERLVHAAKFTLVIASSSIMDTVGDFFPRGVGASGVRTDHCMTYFDHKYADGTSLPRDWIRVHNSDDLGWYRRKWQYVVPADESDSAAARALREQESHIDLRVQTDYI
jgi:hypothetical protein